VCICLKRKEKEREKRTNADVHRWDELISNSVIEIRVKGRFE